MISSDPSTDKRSLSVATFTTRVDVELNCVVHIWHKSYLTSEEFREGLDNIIKLKEQADIHHLIADNTKLNKIPVEDERWLLEDWLPRTVANDRTVRVAAIVPKNVFGRISVEKILAQAEQKIEGKMILRYFASLEEAEQWLKTTNQQADIDYPTSRTTAG